MKKTSRLLFRLLIIFALALTTGCSDSQGKVDENIKNVKIVEKAFKEKEAEVYLLEVSGMKDESLQKKINENIQKAVLSLANKGEESFLDGQTEVVFFNDRLLVELFDGSTGDNTAILKGIHLDLTSGKVYEPVEIFKKDAKYEEEILKIAQENDEYRLYYSNKKDWAVSAFESNWDAKKNNQFFVLTKDYLWVYTFSLEEKGERIVPGYAIPYDAIKHLIDEKSALWQAMTSGESRAEELYFAVDLFETRAEIEKRENEEKIAAIQKAANAKVTAEKMQEIVGIWFSLPLQDKYSRVGGDIRFNVWKNKNDSYSGYIDVGSDQIHFGSFSYDAGTGEFVPTFMNDTITGQPRYAAGPPKKKLTKMTGAILDFYMPAGSVKLVPGNPEKLIVSLRGIPASRAFDLYYNVEYELVRAEYANSLGAAASTTKTTGNITKYSPEPHWLTGQWTTLSGDMARFELSRSGLTATLRPLKDDGSLLKSPNDFVRFNLLWDEAEKAWAMTRLLGGASLKIEEVIGYIRPSSGSKDVPSETLDLELFGYKWPSYSGGEVWAPRAKMERI